MKSSSKIRPLASCLRSCSRFPRSGRNLQRSRRSSSRSRAVPEPLHGSLFRRKPGDSKCGEIQPTPSGANRDCSRSGCGFQMEADQSRPGKEALAPIDRGRLQSLPPGRGVDGRLCEWTNPCVRPHVPTPKRTTKGTVPAGGWFPFVIPEWCLRGIRNRCGAQPPGFRLSPE